MNKWSSNVIARQLLATLGRVSLREDATEDMVARGRTRGHRDAGRRRHRHRAGW